MEPLCAALLLLLAPSPVAIPASASAVQSEPDAGDAAYRYLVALSEEALHARLVTEAERFLAEHPRHARAAAARHRLAEALFALARFGDAAPHYSTLLEARFELAAECALRLGECRLAQGDARAAAAALERALTLEAAYLHAHAAQLLGEARLALAEWPAARAAYQRALELEPEDEVAALARRGLAWCALREGDHARAEARAREFLARHPQDPRAAELQLVLGAALLELGRGSEALEAYGAVPPRADLADEALRGAAFAQLGMQRHLDAARTFALLLERHPGSAHAPEAALQRAGALLAAGDAKQALSALEHPAAGASGEVRWIRAHALLAEDRPEEALAELERALSERPAAGSAPAGEAEAEPAARLELARGHVLARLGRAEQAAGAYESAGGAEGLLLAALVSSNAGRHAEAERLARGVLGSLEPAASQQAEPRRRTPARTRELPPGDFGPAIEGTPGALAARARLVLGEALLATDRPAEAALELEPAARAFRGHEIALELRARSSHAWALYRSGDLQGAAQGFSELAEMEGDAPEIEQAGVLAARALLDPKWSLDAGQGGTGTAPRSTGTSQRNPHRAQRAGESQREGEARAVLLRHLERHPRGARAAEALLLLARLGSGTDELERLLAEHPESPLRAAAWLELAERLMAAGEHGQAAAAQRRLLDEHPDDPGVHAARYGLAWCLRATGEAERAALELLPLTEAEQGVPLELRAAALELAVWCRLESGDAQEAARALRALAASTLAPAPAPPPDRGPALEAAPAAGSSLATLVACARAAARALVDADGGGAMPAPGDDRGARASEAALAPGGAQAPAGSRGATEAVALLGELAALVGDARAREELLLEGAWIALEAGDLTAAQELAGAILAADSASAGGLELLYFAGHAREQRGEQREAASLYGQAAAPGSPLAAEAHYKQGFAWLALSEHELAAQSFRALCASHAGHELEGEARYLAGEALYRAGDAAAAVEELKAFRARHPRHQVLPRALFRLGLAYAQLERHAEAAGVLEELGRKAPDFEARAEAELWRGRALLRTGDERGGRRALDNVLARDRGQLADRARIELGRLELAAERADEALSHLLKVALLSAHADEVAEAGFLAGRCLELQGEIDQALARYEALLREHPGSPFADPARERSEHLRDSKTPRNRGADR